MSQITYTTLGEHLPPGAIEFVGANLVKFNFSTITNEPIDLDSPALEGIVKFLDGLSNLNKAINEERKTTNQEPIDFCIKSLTGTPDSPQISYVVTLDINTQSFVDNLVDPTAELEA